MRTPEQQQPYPALLPFQVFDYPIAHLMKTRGPVPAALWPPEFNPKVAAWKEKTAHLPEGGKLIYIHVPFCPFFCHFCFLYKTREGADRKPERKEQFTQALIRHIRMVAARYTHEGGPFTAVYFGGGTPTELTPDQLGRILQAVREAFPLSPDVEITLEAVANRAFRERLDEYCEQGFNRISFGVQSLHPEVRRAIGRGESVEDYEHLVALLRDRPNIPFNVDLMVCLPGQTVASFAEDVQRVADWGVGSLDIYTYWMVPGSRYYDGVFEHKHVSPEYGKNLLEFRVTAKRLLRQLGFRPVATEAYVRSDINNFMKSTFGGGGHALGTSLAFGPSAFGFINGTLHRDVPDLAEYIDLVNRDMMPFQCRETLSLERAQRRALLMGIQRLTIPRLILETHRSWLKAASRWKDLGLVQEREHSFDLTDWGATWFNQMQLEILPLREQFGMSRMLGSARNQLQSLREEGNGNQLMGEFARAIGDGGLRGKVQLAAYQGYLQIMSLPALRDDAYNFAGKVPANKSPSS